MAPILLNSCLSFYCSGIRRVCRTCSHTPAELDILQRDADEIAINMLRHPIVSSGVYIPRHDPTFIQQPLRQVLSDGQAHTRNTAHTWWNACRAPRGFRYVIP